jgi:apolipoprotein N-acyltransferase
VLVVAAYDAWAWNREQPASGTLRVGIVQPNVPLAIKRRGEEPSEQWRKLAALTREAARRGAQLIVWPETARPLPLYHRVAEPETFAMAEVQALARSTGVPLLVGVEYVRVTDGERHELYNAAMAVDEHGRLLDDWGAKVYLVPFTEVVPFRKLLGPLLEGRGGEWAWLSGGFDPGPRSALIDLAGARIGTLVCYEQLFPDLARELRESGAQLQVVITNDAWWRRSLFQPYLANALRLRAIENRTDYVRVANTGISGFVDAHGRYRARTKLFEEAVVVQDVRLTERRTVYSRTGDLVAWVAIAGLAGAALGSRGGARVRRGQPRIVRTTEPER